MHVQRWKSSYALTQQLLKWRVLW